MGDDLDTDTHQSSTRQIVMAATVGSIVEYYDFAVYGYLATTIALVFFVQGDSATALLASLATFAVAFLVRPIGAIVFGHIGDKLGRRKALSLALIIMTVSSTLIGLLPGYASVGVIAALALLALRLVQGISTGGELPAAVVFVGEHADPHRRGFLVGMTQLGVVIGTLMASGAVSLLITTVSAEALNDWGWRIPFLLAVPIGAVGIYIRMKLEDSPVFKQLQDSEGVSKLPLSEMFRDHGGALLRTIGLSTISVASYFVVFVYLTIYIADTHGHSVAIWSTTIALAVSAAAILVFARLSDVLGRKKTFLWITGSLLVTVWPLMEMLASPVIPLVFLAHTLLGIMAGGLMPVLNTTIPELFPTAVRGTGMGLGFNLANVLAGGTAPFVIAQLSVLFPTTAVPIPAIFIGLFAFVALISALTLKPTEGLSFAEIDKRLSVK